MEKSKGRLSGKVIIITGAAQNIGRESAVACLMEGAQVIAVDIQDDKLGQLQLEHPEIKTEHLDITNEGEVARVIMKYTSELDVSKNVNTLFNCAGYNCKRLRNYVHIGSVHNTTVEEWDRSFNVNVKGMFFMCKYIVQQWLKLKMNGTILNMASVTSSIKGVPERFAYASSKAAVIGLTKSVAVDYVDKGIRANALCPGTIDTSDLHDNEYLKLCGDGDPEKGLQTIVNRQKMGRLGKMEEIAATVVYLASNESAFMTGTEIKIDGGWSL